MVKQWNSERSWGLDEQLRQLPKAPIVIDRKRLTTVVLVPYLDTPQRTFTELWAIAESRYSGMNHVELGGRYNGRIKTKPGVVHPSMELRWEVIDFGSDYDNRSPTRPPADYTGLAQSPSAGVLAAIALFPLWVEAMVESVADSSDYIGPEVATAVWIPGYQYCHRLAKYWPETPSIGGEGSWLALHAFSDERPFAIPSFVEYEALLDFSDAAALLGIDSTDFYRGYYQTGKIQSVAPAGTRAAFRREEVVALKEG